jgi:hypothetical protein
MTSELANPADRRTTHCAPSPCYASSLVTLYNADFRDVLPLVGVDCVITDPPYPGYKYEWEVPDLRELGELANLHGFYFWPATVPFPLKTSARHIWAKSNENIGPNAERYEELHEVNGKACGVVMRHAVINCPMNATINRDEYCNHPCQKPIKLMQRLVAKTTGCVLDPFMGSGTTAIACLRAKRKFIGIEKDVKHFQTALERIKREESQGTFL